MLWVGQVYFYVCAAVAILGALATVVSKNPIRGAMGLLLMIVAIAGLFLALNAQFLAAIQLIVYAGAIVVLFLFVIMLLGPSSVAPRDKRGLLGRAIGGGVFGVSVLAALGLCVSRVHGTTLQPLDADFGSLDAFGRLLFSDGLVPFEFSSALLMVAVVGAVAVARGKQGEEGHTLPSGQPGLAGKGPVTSSFADITSTRAARAGQLASQHAIQGHTK
jgi:NADH-quinone oxidoreductase subunit J